MTAQPNRIGIGGRIDRSRSFGVHFDGRELAAHPGDTLASALLAAGIKVVGRSFKYHRPRGIFSAGVEEPNALVRLREGARAEPNTRATAVEAHAGLRAASQNGWPSLGFDVGALAGAFARFIPAGFYYKTFMGPGRGTGWWMFCERFIRRAAGMGRAILAADPDAYEKVHAFCDVLVIGGGPAGLAAALAACRCGARVILVEQDFALGGSLLAEPAGAPTDDWLDEAVGELRAMRHVRVLPRATAFGAYDGDVYGVLERAFDHVATPPDHQPRQRYWVVRARSAVLAAGAIEQPLVFANNDLPGVMLATAARSYLNRHAVRCGRNVVAFTGNDSAYAAACDLARGGAAVTVVDLRQDIPAALIGAARDCGVAVLCGHAVLKAHGGKAVEAVTIGPIDLTSGRLAGPTSRVDCDLLLVSGGFAPTLHLWNQRGGRPVFDASRATMLPDPDSVPSLRCAGATAGRASLADCIRSGHDAGLQAARRAGCEAAASTVSPPVQTVETPSWSREPAFVSAVRDARGEVPAKAFVDLQHDVTCADIALAQREGYESVEHLKRYTTAGMATDQGKTSSINALRHLAELRGATVAAVGTTTFRPPYTPISFGALVGREHGRHFRPTRRSPLHDWHVANGAVFIDAGLWQRPWYYPQSGESLRAASMREAGHVRRAVGLVDVSSLGKIAAQGPDAAEFLDRVYVNRIGSLRVGRLRYGVMLRDDGFVLDDGVVARLSPTEFFLSTTTANAEKVLAALEHLLQTAWTSLKVELTSVTDQWAAIAVAGPSSRALLEAVGTGADLSRTAMPNLTWRDGKIAGAAVRIHRMSYSGELAYEVYVPSGHGERVCEALIAAGKPFGAVPYGTEAMGALRVEKGHVAGGEIDGRTTLKDLGLERLADARSSFVGSVLRRRPLLEDPARPTLVGLQSLDPPQPLRAGALLFPAQGKVAGHGEGHVTSVTFSPALGTHIGLGLLARGETRRGEIIRCVDLLAGSSVEVRVSAPCGFDPEGTRQNA